MEQHPDQSGQEEQKVQIGLPNKSHAPLIIGIIFISIGIYFLLERYDLLPPFSTSWPILIMIVGVAFIIGYILNLRRR